LSNETLPAELRLAQLTNETAMNPINDELKAFLNLATLPARFNKEQAAGYLGFEPDQVTVLIQKGLLKPLGRPAPNGDKFFAKVELENLKRDKEWLSKATLAVTLYWQNRNASKAKNANVA
jgi:hypothetical protein